MQRRLFLLASFALITACGQNRKACPEGSGCVANPDSPPKTGTILRASFGKQPGQLGVSDAEEGNAEAPMSLVFDPKTGEVLLLDQLNLRVQVFLGGALKKVISIPSGTVQDLALLANGNILLLDRLKDAQLMEIDREGSVLGTTSVVGDGIASGAEISALFSNERGIWADIGKQSILLLDPSGVAPQTREIQPGFPANDQVYKVQGTGRTLSIISTPSHQATGQQQTLVEYPSPVTGIMTLRVDKLSNVYLATRHLLDDGKTTSESCWMVVLDAQLHEVRRFALSPSETAREVFRELEIGPNGEIFQLHITQDAALVERY